MKKTNTTNTTKKAENKAKQSNTKAKQSKAENKANEQKQKKMTFAERREILMKEIELKENIQFESEQTAVNKVDSAMLLHDNAIMLTLVSAETQKASRVLEIWIHAKRNDICISKRLFDSLAESNEKMKAYKEQIDNTAKCSKYVIKLENDEITKAFTNEFVKAL